MNDLPQDIVQYLDDLRSRGYSSPSGTAWHDFWGWLGTYLGTDLAPPPKPLILAASGESNHVKHQRFISQLQFAHENGFATEALNRLRKIPLEKWSYCPLKDWHVTNY